MEERSFAYSSNLCSIYLIPSRNFITKLYRSQSCGLWLVQD
jgi:hypothetical protein